LSDRYAVNGARAGGNNLIVYLTNADAPTPCLLRVKTKARSDGDDHRQSQCAALSTASSSNANGGSALAEDTAGGDLLDKGSPFRSI